MKVNTIMKASKAFKYIIKVENTICRVCLKEGCIPIQSKANDLTEAINTFSGLEISSNDCYPKYLCQLCCDLLESAILFRETAQKTDKILKQKQTQKSLDLKDEPAIIIIQNDIIKKSPKSSSDFLQDNVQGNFESAPNKDNKGPIIIKNSTKKSMIGLHNKTSDFKPLRRSVKKAHKRNECKICKKPLALEDYKTHMASHKQRYMCDVCGRSFRLNQQLTAHLLVHSDNLPYQCSECPYKGRYKASLKRHMRSHTGERPYQCDQCAYKGISKSNLNTHMLMRHTHRGEHNFKCDCGRGFYSKRELEIHIKVQHTGLKDEICRICGKAYGCRRQRMRHELKMHKRPKMRSGTLPAYMQVELKQQNNAIET